MWLMVRAGLGVGRQRMDFAGGRKVRVLFEKVEDGRQTRAVSCRAVDDGRIVPCGREHGVFPLFFCSPSQLLCRCYRGSSVCTKRPVKRLDHHLSCSGWYRRELPTRVLFT